MLTGFCRIGRARVLEPPMTAVGPVPRPCAYLKHITHSKADERPARWFCQVAGQEKPCGDADAPGQFHGGRTRPVFPPTLCRPLVPELLRMTPQRNTALENDRGKSPTAEHVLRRARASRASMDAGQEVSLGVSAMVVRDVTRT